MVTARWQGREAINWGSLVGACCCERPRCRRPALSVWPAGGWQAGTPPGTRPTGKTAGGAGRGDAPSGRLAGWQGGSSCGAPRHVRRAVTMSCRRHAAAASAPRQHQCHHASRAFARRSSSSLKRPTSSNLISKMQVSNRSCQAWAPTRSVASRNAVPSLLPCKRVGGGRGEEGLSMGWLNFLG